MELLQLKYFKTVADIGKITAAAEQLFISPPALSTSISRLEKELGMPLFDRTNNRIVLNRQGHIFLRYVNQIFSSLEYAQLELQQSITPQNPHVSIACIASSQWVNLVTAFSQEHPHFTLSCTSLKLSQIAGGGLPAQHSYLFAYEGDIPGIYLEELDSIPLFEDQLTLMVNAEHPLAEKESVNLQDFLNETIFLPMQDYSMYERLVQLFEANSIPLPGGNAYSYLTSQHLVAQGLGISFSTTHTGNIPSSNLRYIPIKESCAPWVARMYWRKNRMFTQEDSVFKSFVEKYYHTDHYKIH